jgi:hypothetical protein
MGTVTLDQSQVGAVLGNNGAITGLTVVNGPSYTGPPVAAFDATTGLPSNDYFVLADMPVGQRPRTLMSVEASDPALQPGTVLSLSPGMIYVRLICPVLPAGASYMLTTSP